MISTKVRLARTALETYVREARILETPKRYGLIVTNGQNSGLHLPNLEGVDTVEEQIAITKEKAGIAPHDQNVVMYRFEVTRYT